MLKFLRKHNKWILVVGGTLLMVTWLIGPTTQKLGLDPASKTIAKIGSQKVTWADEMRATTELTALDEWGDPFVRDLLRLDPRDGMHWLLLTKEAEAGGFVAGMDDGREWLPQASQLLAQLHMQRDMMLRFRVMQEENGFEKLAKALENSAAYAAGRSRMTMQGFYEALAKLRGVMRMENAYFGAARVSDRRADEYGRYTRDGAVIDYLFIPADLWAAGEAEPAEAELAAFFEKYRTAKPGTGEYGVGYLQPDRAKIEWMELNRDGVAAAITIDLVDANKRYRQQRDKYKGDFAAEREAVVRDMKAETVDKIFHESQMAVQVEVQRAVGKVEADGRYKKLPADWDQQRPRMEAIAQAVVERAKSVLGLTIPLPTVTIKSSGWLTRNDLEALPGIGRAVARQGGFNTTLSELVLMAKELGGKGQFPVQAGIPLAEGYLDELAGGGGAGNRYYVTILDAKKESPPDSLDEVRAQVVKDWKRVHAYEALKSRVEEYRAKAVAGGLEAVLDSLPKPEAKSEDAETEKKVADKGPEIARGAFLNRSRVGRPREGAPGADIDVPEVRDAVMAAAEKIDPIAPLDTIDKDKATVAVATPSRLGVVVARVLAARPLTIEALRLEDRRIENEISGLGTRTGPGAPDPFSLAAIKERLKYTQVAKSQKETDGEPATDGGGS